MLCAHQNNYLNRVQLAAAYIYLQKCHRQSVIRARRLFFILLLIFVSVCYWLFSSVEF